MSDTPSVDRNPSDLPADENRRHDELVDVFGQFVFWIRNWTLRASRGRLDSEEAREKMGTIRRKPYDSVANMSKEDKEITLLYTETVINEFIEKLIWSLGNGGIDARFGVDHAYRFEIILEILNIRSGDVIHKESINRGGKFLGSYWGRWLNRYRDR